MQPEQGCCPLHLIFRRRQASHALGITFRVAAICIDDIRLDDGGPSRGCYVLSFYRSPDMCLTEVADATRFLAVRGSLKTWSNVGHVTAVEASSIWFHL